MLTLHNEIYQKHTIYNALIRASKRKVRMSSEFEGCAGILRFRGDYEDPQRFVLFGRAGVVFATTCFHAKTLPPYHSTLESSRSHGWHVAVFVVRTGRKKKVTFNKQRDLT